MTWCSSVFYLSLFCDKKGLCHYHIMKTILPNNMSTNMYPVKHSNFSNKLVILPPLTFSGIHTSYYLCAMQYIAYETNATLNRLTPFFFTFH